MQPAQSKGAEPKEQELAAVGRTAPDCKDIMSSVFSPMCQSCLDAMGFAFPSLLTCLFRNTGVGPSILGINAIKPNVCNYFSLAYGLWDQRWRNTMYLMYFAMNKCIYIMWFSLRENRLTTKLKATTSWFFGSLPTHLKLVCRLSSFAVISQCQLYIAGVGHNSATPWNKTASTKRRWIRKFSP